METFKCRPANHNRRKLVEIAGAGKKREERDLAHEVIEEAREGLKKSEHLRTLKINELAQKAGEAEATGR